MKDWASLKRCFHMRMEQRVSMLTCMRPYTNCRDSGQTPSSGSRFGCCISASAFKCVGCRLRARHAPQSYARTATALSPGPARPAGSCALCALLQAPWSSLASGLRPPVASHRTSGLEVALSLSLFERPTRSDKQQARSGVPDQILVG